MCVVDVTRQLFVFVNESRLETGLYPMMRTLLQFFNPYIGEPDPDLTVEIEEFMDVLLETECMTACHEFLQLWGE